ncbi:hypothetical protein BGZ76_001945 [Entomortierella beljakovae]|nr:hypothetical protein BGZ76_001945 [Entomortierella beljakovae]
MGLSIELVGSTLPLAYSLSSALLIFYLSKKPVNLNQYEQLRDTLDNEDNNRSQNEGTSRSDSAAVINSIQAQFQAQRASGLSINLIRFGLTAFQLGLTILSATLLQTDKNEEDQPDRFMNSNIDSLAWTYALILSFVFLVKPTLARQFWIRLQMDIFYVLEFTLSSLQLYFLDVLTSPTTEWALSTKLVVVTCFTNLLLIVVSVLTKPNKQLIPIREPKEGEIIRTPSAEFSSSFYSQITFSWMNPLVNLGYRKSLQEPDLPDLDITDISQFTVRRFEKTKKSTFFRTLAYSIRSDLIIQFLWVVPFSILIVAQPLCLKMLTEYFECKDCGPPTLKNYGMVLVLFITSIFCSGAQQQALHRGRRIFVKVVSVCNSQVFLKTLRRKNMSSPAESKDTTIKAENEEKKPGRTLNISNLVGVDIKEMEDAFCYIHELYGFPFQFGLSAYLLYQVLGKSAWIGIAFMVITLPIPAFLFSTIMKLFDNIMNSKDDRMDSLNEMLSAIRIVKFFGWESKFVEKITAARERELQVIKKSYIQYAFAGIAWMIIPLLNIVVFFWSYTVYYGNDISASILFTTLSLFEIMSMSLGSIPWAIMSTMRASVSMNRISKYLEEEEIVRDTTITKIDGKARVQSSSIPVIGFVDATFAWPNKEAEKVADKALKKRPWFKNIFSKAPVEEPVVEPEAAPERFKLQNISADFPVGQLSLIVGPTGSGKTALLLSLLGELDRVEGHVYLPRLDYVVKGQGSGIAYVAQTAWLQNATIRNNILFGKKFDQALYDEVIEGCALATDFATFDAGDNTEIGEQGITLSGGQKQRVALARAIYSNAHVLLLDDCLSAVDSHTGEKIFQTLTGPLLKDRTIVMATHQVQLTLNAASYVVVLEKGEVVGTGSPETVTQKRWVENVTIVAPSSDSSSEVSTLHGEESGKKASKQTEKKAGTKLVEDEKKVEGSVSIRVYLTYIVASGGVPFWSGVIIFMLLREAITFAENAWFAMWANSMAETTGEIVLQAFNTHMPHSVVAFAATAFTPKSEDGNAFLASALFGSQDKHSVTYYLGVYTLLGIFAMLCGALSEFYTMVIGNIKGSRAIHAKLLHKISRAKIRFFDTTPIGRITNRFSTDMATIDDEVLRSLDGFLKFSMMALGIVFTISLRTPSFLIAAVIIVAINVFIGAYYIPISRDLKRLNSISKSPILNHFNEALTGIATIRAYGFEDRFLSKNLVNLDTNNRTFFLLWSTNRWLHWRVDVTGALVSLTTAFLILQNWDKIASGWAAMSLSYSLRFTMIVVWIIRFYAENEINMNAVERVCEYMDLEEEPAAIIEGSRPPASWPHIGEIEVEHLTMQYAPNTPEVIKDISIKISGGEKVGVVGRTGSGKSTFAISLFRFMDPTHGTIRIDGIDIYKIGLHDLRSKLTIIPQDPILFKGTLRSNLDPFGELEDRELWEALRRSHLIPADAAKRQSDLLPVPDNGASSSNSTGKSPTPSVKDDVVDPSKITLDTPVKESGSNFSQGQRQLIALARALVRQSKIIVMDEATASVDYDTDLKIQTTIREEMADATLITIAHRLRTIADFDRVLVLDAGVVAEFDKPYNLLQKKDGLFRTMCERSSDYDALLSIAEAKEKKDAQRL